MASWFESPVIVLVVLGVIGILWKAATWYGAVNQDCKTLKETADKDRSTLKKFMEEIRADIKKILQALPPPRTAIGARPARLTEFGERVAAKVDAHAWAAMESQSILDDATLVAMEPYQIEAFCDRHVDQQSRVEGLVQEMVQRAIYEFGIDAERAVAVLRIPLRNALLDRRSEIQAQVDAGPEPMAVTA